MLALANLVTSITDWQRTAGRDTIPLGRSVVWRGRAEREITLESAAAQAQGELTCLSWIAQHRILDSSQPTAAQCRLHDASGKDVPYGIGAGKGYASVAYVGALFEAIEHAFSGPILLDTLPIEVRLPGKIMSQDWDGDRVLAEISALGAPLGCLRYEALDGGPERYLPVGLWAPWYISTSAEMTRHRQDLGDSCDYTAVRSYSSNTGCAIGATQDEALLHALNEWVERDAMSIFLLSTVYDGGAMPPLLDREGLPPSTEVLLESAEDRFGQPVYLFDLTTDIGIPVVLAYLADADLRIGPGYGMGASLSGLTAIERAITELVQGDMLALVVAQHASGEELSSSGDDMSPTYEDVIAEHDIDRAVRSRLGPHPRLLACAQLSFSTRLDGALIGEVPPDCAPPEAAVGDQLRIAIDRVVAAGHRVMATTLKRLPGGTVVVQVQCPGLERFHLITKGHLALPGARGGRARRPRMST